METAARSQFETENNITIVDPSKDGLYNYDEAEQKSIADARPWALNPHYFKYVRISAVALLKMVMHARSGGSIEVMGLMQGKIAHETFIVMDAFPLPVEGTETRVNAHEQAYEYMAQYSDCSRNGGRKENVVGWYHSHPGYGCWLSGIDVNTEMSMQQFMDPFLAVVVDPDRTISAGKVDIGGFRTFPESYKPPNSDEEDEYQTIPLSKIEDFGAHSSRYYSLEVSHFKSSLDTRLLDLLWNKYWVATLSQSPLLNNREYSTKQMLDLAQKIGKSENAIAGKTRSSMPPGKGSSSNAAESAFQKIVKESNKITSEEIAGFFSNVVKERVFAAIEAPDTTQQQA
ncbi:Mov34-domain-containing protein [Wilcoxina mikolae CBS 423.85]|nr:Mov34-domain-containing protein [Wilcoxina mikolae CBS 423.85]